MRQHDCQCAIPSSPFSLWQKSVGLDALLTFNGLSVAYTVAAIFLWWCKITQFFQHAVMLLMKSICKEALHADADAASCSCSTL